MSKVRAADLFAGAGGTSTGLAQACEAVGRKPDLLAVNHWDVAVETHALNHPWARHLCTGLDAVDPKKVVPGGHLNLLVASPECTHHSIARGGKPINDQSRASAWLILRWASDLYIENILIENVKEFQTWGPLGANSRPLKSKRGQTFHAFVQGLRSLGYVVDWRVLNAADYGDATTRERLFIIARRGRRKINWPEHTHAAAGDVQPGLFGDKKRWRPAREIIDWSIPGESIFRRKRPLAPATLERIAAGLRKFGGKNADPFLVVLRNHADARSVHEPLPTVTAGGQHIGVCQPFLVPFNGNRERDMDRARATDAPLPTITAGGNRFGLVQPFILPHRMFDGMQVDSVEEPLRTFTAKGGSSFGLVQPFMFSMEHGRRSGGGFVLPVHHGKNDHRTYSLDGPMPTITTVDAWGMVQPFLVKYYGTGEASSVSEPIDTITAKDRFGLVQCDQYAVDILFRMLQPHELAAAMSFPEHYRFAGNREQKVKQIGNAVPVGTARALCQELIV